MIIKEREIPMKIPICKALLRRLPKDYPKKHEIEVELAKSLAGFKGEQAVDFYLRFIDEKYHQIYHSLRLPYKNLHFFQMDTLIVTTKFILILEIKYFAGELFFDREFHQLIRTLNGIQEVFPCPIHQATRHKHQLSHLLKTHQIPETPIEILVVISNPSSLIKSSKKIDNVIHLAHLLAKIESFHKKHTEEIFSTKDNRKLMRCLLKNHTPYHPDLLKYFNICQTEIITGVHCPECAQIPINRKNGLWRCPNCHYSSREMYKVTLADYYLLINTSITNSEFRNFFQITSSKTAQRLLQAAELPCTGETKDRIYQLHESVIGTRE